MAKIIHFPKTTTETPNDFLDETFEIAKKRDVNSIIVCLKLKDGEVMTGYFNAGFGTKQEMLGHIQCDVIDQMILSNSERYGE